MVKLDKLETQSEIREIVEVSEDPRHVLLDSRIREEIITNC